MAPAWTPILVTSRCPSSRPTFANTSSANCSSSRVCVAVTIVRTRALSRATVGNAMPCAKTPSSNSRSDSFIASAPSPAITGVIGLSLSPVLKPSGCEPGLEEPGVLPEPLDELRLLSSTSSAAMHAAATDGRMRGREQERPRAVIEELDQRCGCRRRSRRARRSPSTASRPGCRRGRACRSDRSCRGRSARTRRSRAHRPPS